MTKIAIFSKELINLFLFLTFAQQNILPEHEDWSYFRYTRNIR